MSEYIPTKPVWLVFDLSNGHKGSVRYVWWFDTEEEALEHIAYVRKTYKYGARYSKPQKWGPICKGGISEQKDKIARVGISKRTRNR